MQIYPAVDIKNGKCVRLKQGNFDAVTVYEQNPVKAAQNWIAQGASYLHIVDLDGAKQGDSQNEEIIAQIVKLSDIPVQTGGGVRSLEDVERKLSKGVARVILGTVAVRQPELVKQAIQKFGADKIVVGIDAKDGKVAVAGWEEVSNLTALELCLQMKTYGVKTIIYTDIAKDGMMSGVNVDATKELIDKTGLEIIASGGISNMQDLEKVQTIGVQGVIVGKALYQGSLQLKEITSVFEKKKKIVLEMIKKESARLNSKKIIFSIIGFFLLLFVSINLKYDKGYNIIIENKTEQYIEKISLLPNPRSESIEKMDITTISPGEKIKIKRTFYQPGESFVAQIDTPKEKNKEIPLAYIYSPKAVNIVFIIVEGVENGKITDFTVKSFENFPSIFWWLRVLYDYHVMEYRGI